MPTFDDRKQRTLIELCVSLGKTATNTQKKLEMAIGKRNVCRGVVYKQYKQFSDRQAQTKADPRPGRPRTIKGGPLTPEKEIVEANGRASLEERVEFSHSTTHHILTETLEMSKAAV